MQKETRRPSLPGGIICFVLLLTATILSLTLAIFALAADVLKAAETFGILAAISGAGSFWFLYRLRTIDLPLSYQSAILSYWTAIVLSTGLGILAFLAFSRNWPENSHMGYLLLVNVGFVVFGLAIKLYDTRFLPPRDAVR